MQVTCLSVPNPRSYLICAGVADVENCGFDTDYRGPVYIHSTGRRGFSGMPDMSEYPVPVIQEFNDMLERIQELDQSGRYIGFPDAGVRVVLKDEDSQSDQAVAEYALLADAYAAYRKEPTKPFFHVKAIIGKVDLVDVVENSSSGWAKPGYKHWILRRPRLYAEPIIGIKTSRTGLWTCDLPDQPQGS